MNIEKFRNNKIIQFLLLVFVFCISFSNYQRGFQFDSETLVTGKMRAKLEGMNLGKESLGRYYNLAGPMVNYERTVVNDARWENNYSKKESSFIISNHGWTSAMIKNAVKVADVKNNTFVIEKYEMRGKYIYIKLKGKAILNEKNNGPIEKLRFIDKSGKTLENKWIGDYRSQLGLQGWLFNILTVRALSFEQNVKMVKTICILLSSLTFAYIVYLVRIKYGFGMGLCFFFTFLTSPWIINFAPNLYWVEFTWFIPMAIGLWCSNHLDDWKQGLGCYLLAFVSVLVKCLCGYEYVSTVMVGLIMFPLADALLAFIHHDNKKYDCLKLIAILSVAALLGFFTAFSIHAYHRGDGNIYAGAQSIYQRDILRRTWAIGNAKDKIKAEKGSLEAGGWEVFNKYLLFRTKIGNLTLDSLVIGIPAKYFRYLALSPLCIIFYYKARKKWPPFSCDISILYVLSFLAATSWYILAKSHSYVHTHMNYVLWYFGFVQISLYCILATINEYLIQKEILNPVGLKRITRWL